jgi:integrase
MGKSAPKPGRVAQNTYSEPLAKRSGTGAKSPAKPPKKEAWTVEESDYLTERELGRLFAAAGAASKRDEAIMRITFCKALRASEVGALQLSDYNRRDNTLRVRRLKRSRSGEFPLYPRELQSLRAYLRERGDVEGPLFLSRHGRGISRRQLDHLMKQYGAAAGLPKEKRHMHVLKHTRGTHLNDAGEGVVMIQHELGHRDIRNTQRYTHVSAPAKAAMFERLKEKW